MSIHVDIGADTGRTIPAITLWPLHLLTDSLDFEIDIHVATAYIQDVPGWTEVIHSRRGHQELGLRMDHLASQKRAEVIDILRKEFAVHGKVLRLANIQDRGG